MSKTSSQDGAATKTVGVANLTEKSRQAIVSTVVPFWRGEHRGEALTDDEGRPAQQHQFGAPWPDGSWRYARVFLPGVSLQPGRTILRLRRDQGALSGGFSSLPSAFSFHEDVQRNGANLRFQLASGSQAVTIDQFRIIEAGHLAATAEANVRVPGTPVWGRLTLRLYSKSAVGHWWFRAGVSDPDETNTAWQMPELALGISGAHSFLHHDERAPSEVTDGTRWFGLDAGGQWLEGQALGYSGGVILGGDSETAEAETLLPVLAVSQDWAAEGSAYGPFGLPIRSELDGAIDEMLQDPELAAAEYSQFQKHEPFEPSVHGCNPRPKDTGDQADFCATPALLEALGCPDGLYGRQRSAYQELCRPTMRAHQDGSRDRRIADPDVFLWDSAVHWTSPNQLGKTQEIQIESSRRDPEGRAWWGHNRQHFSTLNVASHALLTGDPLSVEICDHLTDCWMGQNRVRSGSPTLDGIGASRDVGRGLQSASWLYLVTGRGDLERRVRDRIDLIDRTWPGQDAVDVATLSVNPPDPRKLGGRSYFAMPWQDGLGVNGLESAANVFESGVARRISQRVAEYVAQWGIAATADGFTVVDAIEWRENGMADQARAEYYQPYLPWVAGALIVCERTTADTSLRERCRQALSQLMAGVADAETALRTAEWTTI